jgi:succinate dehydrogenase/fumarate reductase cytochrome b subunit
LGGREVKLILNKIASVMIEVILEIIMEILVYGLLVNIGVGIRKLFLFNKSIRELRKQSGWNILVGVTFIVGIVILIVQIV